MKQSVAGRMFREAAALRGSIVAPLTKSWQRERRTIAETRSKTQLLLTDPAALHILICVRAARRFPGAMAEAGVFNGGSARLICENKSDAPLHLFDVFDSLQGPVSAAGDEFREHFGKVHGSRRAVERLLAGYSDVHFHEGVFPATAEGLDELRFSFVHLDLDLPGATRAALEFFHPRLVAGGILVGDDYSDPYVAGCFDGYFEGRRDTVIELPWSQVMIVRQANSA